MQDYRSTAAVYGVVRWAGVRPVVQHQISRLAKLVSSVSSAAALPHRTCDAAIKVSDCGFDSM